MEKQNILTIIIVLLTLVLFVMIGSIVYEEKINLSKQQSENLIESDKQNEAENNISKDDSEIEQVEEDEETQQDDEQYLGEEEKNEGDSTQSNDEKAIEAVKKEWGNDDSVTFSIEQKNGTKYYVAVKSENEPTVWYEVDTENWEVSEY